MTPIQYALNDLRHKIPESILRFVFSPRPVARPQSMWQSNPELQSIDQGIRDKVIEGRVNIDCNLKGSMQIAIDLSTVSFDQPDMSTKVFRIPYERTDGRKIVSVQSLNYLDYHNIPTYQQNEGSALFSAAMDLYRAAKNMPIVSTANCQLIGDNTVIVKDDIQHISNRMALLCLVENDADMANLNAGAFKAYARLVELATKAYVYNNLNLQMEQGAIVGGMTLGRIREVVDSYADANELYEEYFRETWGKVSFTNDRPRMNEFVRSMLGRGI